MSYAHVSSKERYVIYHLRLFGLSFREIGRRLKRHHATIIREVRRNSPDYRDAVYWHELAEEKAHKRARMPRHYRKASNHRLIAYVFYRLKQDWPPEMICGRMKMDYPQDPRMRLSPETIYRWVYLDALQGGELYSHLRWRHRKRRKQRRYGSCRGLFPARVSISERPIIVAQRGRFGDWEGDLMEGRKGCGVMATLVERKSRYLLVAKMEDKKASSLTRESVSAFRRVPLKLRQTLTVDNGKEFAQFKELERKTGLSVYFADPYCAWQRGLNENTNGLLRFYFPKGMDFRKVDATAVSEAVNKLNHRPRKCLNFRTPHEVFYQAVRGGALAM
jgi:IS30 family transposase